MNFYEKEAAEEQKRQMHIECGGICETCGKFVPLAEAEAAHRIAKAKWALSKYGKDVIHHRFNLAITHPGRCNSAVQIMPESIQAKELIKRIQEDLDGRL